MSERDESIPALGHSYVPHAAQAETCDEPGWEEYQTCSRCDYTTYEEIPPHTPQYEVLSRVAPTCTSTGLTMGTRCALCGKVYTAQQEIPMVDHTLETRAAKQPTCTQPGWESYSACRYCDYSTKIEIPALGHDLSDRAGKTPTCTAIGWQAYQVCSRCSYTTYEELPMLPHTPVTDSAVAATCTATGLTAGSHCSVCGTVITAQQNTAVIPHTAQTMPAVPATCTATGLTAGSQCAVCGAVLTAQQTTEMIPHTPETVPAVAATCSATGLTEGTKCSVCGTVLTAQETVAKLPHTPQAIPAVASTCTVAGLTEGSKCSVCGAILTAQQAAPLAAHTPLVFPAVPATCQATGLTEGSICAVCGAILTEQTDTPRAPHTYELTGTDPATLTANGTDHYACTVCGAVKTEAFASVGSVTLSRTQYAYDGSVKTPFVTVKDADGNSLVKDRDYTVSYPTGRNLPGAYAVTVALCGRYSGQAQRTFVITPQTLTAGNVMLEATSLPYNGAAQHPGVTVKNAAGAVLAENTDYTVTWPSGCKTPKAYTVAITGMGSYEGTVNKTFTIAAQPLDEARVTLEWTSEPYDGTVRQPAVTVKNAAGYTMTENSSYTVAYAEESKFPGTYTVTVTAAGMCYSGSVKKTYKLTRQPLEAAHVTLSWTARSCSGAAQKPTVRVTDLNGTWVLTEGKHYTLTWSGESKDPGSYQVTVTGKGNFSGAVKKNYTITPPVQALSASRVTLSWTEAAYNGAVQQPAVTVRNAEGAVLVKDTDYTLVFSSVSKKTGAYSVTVTGKGSYSGSVRKRFTIIPQPLDASRVTLDWTDKPYSGTVQKPMVTVKNAAGYTMTENSSYTVAYAEDSIFPGVYTVTVTASGSCYSGSVIKTYTLTRQPLDAANVALAWTAKPYSGVVQKPAVTVKNAAGYTMTENTSYTVSYSSESSKYPGTYSVTVTAMGYYSGTVTKTYRLTKQPLNAANMTLSWTARQYNGAVQQPTVRVTDMKGTWVLTEGSHYTVSFAEDSKYPGAYKVTVTGKNNFSGTLEKTYTIDKQQLSASRVTLSATGFTYDGKVHKPTVTVKNAAGNAITLNTSYTVSWSGDCRARGTYTVTVTGKGYYDGTVTKTFTIT